MRNTMRECETLPPQATRSRSTSCYRNEQKRVDLQPSLPSSQTRSPSRIHGGTCELENDIASAPYNAMITAGNQAFFKQGAGCGAWNPITVTLTDECPGVCNNDPVHFDISGITFEKLVKSGKASQLYNAGRILIFYRRVACNYNTNIIFMAKKCSNPNFFAVTSEAVDGDGDLSLVEIQTSNSSWVPMQRMIGAIWSVGIQPNTQKPPFSLRLTSKTNQSVTALNVPNGACSQKREAGRRSDMGKAGWGGFAEAVLQSQKRNRKCDTGHRRSGH
uniref:Expansin-B15-like n=1 Tax=Nicotiana tabacum TaxID=4097 RepID=A0A1S4AML4_TOBAC|nr:PREDICTED: expansin-B15-like [Nicotiana tabacum]